MRPLTRTFVAAAAAALATPAAAGTYYCGSTPTAKPTCPDGSLAVYKAEELQPGSTRPERRAAPQETQRQVPAGAGLFGKWRTNVPASVINRESLIGQRWTEIFAGAASGDLLIHPNGTYAWASYGGKAGRWVPGDDGWPIVLVDTVENRRWKVGFDERSGGRRIYIWDGNSIYYNGNR